MKYLFLVLFITVGCGRTFRVTPIVPVESSDDFSVGKLFTVDGCTVYTFRVGDRNHFFTSCTGTTMETQTYQCGKATCVRSEEIPTRRTK